MWRIFDPYCISGETSINFDDTLSGSYGAVDYRSKSEAEAMTTELDLEIHSNLKAFQAQSDKLRKCHRGRYALLLDLGSFSYAVHLADSQ